MKLSAADEKFLTKVHPDLVKVVRKAADIWPYPDQTFFITCGLRSIAEQKKNIANGASQTMRSRHLPGKTTGLACAVDLAIKIGGKIKWDWPLYAQMAKVMKAAAKSVNVPVEWGGDWKTLKDGPHFQLPWAQYPG